MVGSRDAPVGVGDRGVEALVDADDICEGRGRENEHRHQSEE